MCIASAISTSACAGTVCHPTKRSHGPARWWEAPERACHRIVEGIEGAVTVRSHARPPCASLVSAQRGDRCQPVQAISYHYDPPTPMTESTSDRAPSMAASAGDFQDPTKSQEGEAHPISSHPVSPSHCSHRESLIENNTQADVALNKQQSTPSPPVGEEVVSLYQVMYRQCSSV